MAAGWLSPASATGPAAHASIGYSDYSPVRLDVVAGDTVDWTNDSVRNHTVTDDAGKQFGVVRLTVYDQRCDWAPSTCPGMVKVSTL